MGRLGKKVPEGHEENLRDGMDMFIILIVVMVS